MPGSLAAGTGLHSRHTRPRGGDTLAPSQEYLSDIGASSKNTGEDRIGALPLTAMLTRSPTNRYPSPGSARMK